MTIHKDPIIAILNPSACYGKCKSRGLSAIHQLRQSGLNIDVKLTEDTGHATFLAADAFREGYRHFISIGGDGTNNEVINGLFAHATPNDKPTLSFLPYGTGNSYLREFVRNPKHYSINDFLNARDYSSDVLALTHTQGKFYFINILSIGFIVDVCAHRNKYFTWLYNFGYTLSVLMKTITLSKKDYHFKLDGIDYNMPNTVFISINNSRYTGGDMMIAPSAKIDDGLMDIIIASDVTRKRLLTTFPKIFSGNHIHDENITYKQATSMQFNISHPIPLMVDGEVIELHPIQLNTLSNALIIRV
jgi:diacylglycerol kinase (ATP)